MQRVLPQATVKAANLKRVRRALLAVGVTWVAIASLALSSVAFGQESLEAVTRMTAKVAVESVAKSSLERTGMTLVSVESGLDRVVGGSEPRSIDELKALERQLQKVSNSIREVTVNVRQGVAQGSGVIITADGYVLTAAHVAGKPNRKAVVVLPDGREAKAITLGMNRSVDAGLLKITEPTDKPWPHASLGTSATLRNGQWCIATGHPGGWQPDRGAVIRVGRMLAVLNSTLVTDCSLIGGDSGGPLFDLEGKLIGIHSRIGTDFSDNMHVPVDRYADGWNKMVSGEAWGVLPGYQPVIGVQGESGNSSSTIASVIKDGPADQAGIQRGDIITKFDGHEIQSFEDLKEAVEDCMPGDVVPVELTRDSQRLTIRLIVGVQG